MTAPLSTREACGNALLKLGYEDKDIVVLDADLSVSTQTKMFAEEFPNRFFNVGCAEQNLIGTAAGLAIAGKTVFAGTYAMFINRAWEQIRNTVAHDNLNLKIIIEAEKMIFQEAHRNGPAYIRLNRIVTPTIYDEDYEFEFGKAVEVCDGNDATIIATGTMVTEAIKASEMLKKENISARVLNIHTIKPLDKDEIIMAARDTGNIVTIEEHSIYGGLGGAVAEVLVENYPVPMMIMGVKDRFGESGEYNHLMTKFGLNAAEIVKNVKELVGENR